MDEITTPACVNCGLPVSTFYCSSCGQPNPPKKLGFRTLWMDFQSRVYGLDGMFPRSLKDLTMRPGFVTAEFIRGNRRKYYGPVGYFFLMVTVMIILMSLFNINFSEFSKVGSQMFSAPKPGSGQEEFNNRIIQFISDNLRSFSFAIIPFMALNARLFFRKSGYNVLEHAVLPFYVLGHLYWITIIIFLLHGFFGVPLQYAYVGSFFTIPYFCFANAGFYTYQSKFKVVIKSLFVYLFSYLMFMLLISIIVVILILTDPDIRELLRPSNNL